MRDSSKGFIFNPNLKKEHRHCAICGKILSSNERSNAAPFIGECCNACNSDFIIPTRLAMLSDAALLFRAAPSHASSHAKKIEAVENASKLELSDMKALLNAQSIDIIRLTYDYVACVNANASESKSSINKAWSKFELSKFCRPLHGNVLLIRKEFML